MSQENVEIVKAVFTAWQNRDPASAMSRIHPEIEVDVTAFTFLSISPGRGVAALEGMTREWREVTRSIHFAAEEFIEAGDHVIVRVRFEAEGRESGVPVQVQNFAVYTLRDGLVVAFRLFDRLQDALEAVGPSE